MNLRVQLPAIALALVCSMAIFAQPITADSPFQVRYAANVGPGTPGDSVINITNTGASGGTICVNVYTFSPDEQLISCCSCPVTPNGLANITAKRDLINNTLTPAVPNSIVVKLLATTGGACNAATPGALVTGMAAWGTTTHLPPTAAATSVTETAFTPATLGAAELTRISALCGFIQSNGSGFGICGSCQPGALGGKKK
jgi:hypothetical protein